jgi:sialidase-1
MRAFYLRSEDDGRTFSRPIEITRTFEGFRPQYNWKVIAIGPGHGIQLRNGRLLVPVWLSTAETSPHSPNVVATIYSDDHGQTWRPSRIAIMGGGEITNPNETAAVQLANGHVMLNVRSTSKRHRRVVVTSPDGATRWSAPRFQEELAEPICFGSIVRYGPTSRRGPNRLLFVNPDSLLRDGQPGEPGQSRDRRNLTVQLSEDDGATWTVKRVLDPGWAGYADINVGADQAIYVLYERGHPDEPRLRIAALTLVKFPLSWIEEVRK